MEEFVPQLHLNQPKAARAVVKSRGSKATDCAVGAGIFWHRRRWIYPTLSAVIAVACETHGERGRKTFSLYRVVRSSRLLLPGLFFLGLCLPGGTAAQISRYAPPLISLGAGSHLVQSSGCAASWSFDRTAGNRDSNHDQVEGRLKGTRSITSLACSDAASIRSISSSVHFRGPFV